jgi:zinc/manganese transport system substrate-binding protein
MYKLALIIFLFTLNAHAKLKVITTTTNLANLVEQISGEFVDVESLCRGIQDPHFLEAKPSYIFKLAKADLLISVGAGLEVGWLPLVIRGSRNPKLREGEPRHLIAANHVELLEKSSVKVSRSDGDIHPEGNPHFMLAPTQSIKVGRAILDKLIEIDSKNSSIYRKNFNTYKVKMTQKINEWKKLIPKNLKVVSYHKSLSYFYSEFGIINLDVLEPKPGISPSASHIIGLINKMKSEKVNKIVVENYFDDAVAQRIKKDISYIQIKVVPVGVHGRKEVQDLFELYNYLVINVGN